ncbi:MAG: hypothetical protein C6Y20_19725 [Tagaea sp. CACIAM 22H2]|nr:hypothetical protein [Tagaea sp. CACIAM 22H2]
MNRARRCANASRNIQCLAKKKLCAHAHHFRFNDLRGVPSRAKETPPAQERGRRKNQARNRLRDTACA